MDERTGHGADEEFKAGDGEEGKQAPATKGSDDRSSERQPVRVLIRDEEVGNIEAHSWMHIAPEGTPDDEGHGWKFKVGKAQEGAEDQVYVMGVQREGGEGQDSQGSFLRWIDPHDTEGEGVGGALLYPAGPDDLEAKGFKAGVLKPDASGSWTLQLDDNQG
jgi:hypothetical protein